MDKKYTVKPIGSDSLKESGALSLVWDVFLEFEAPEYSKEGIREFKDFIEYGTIKRMIGDSMLFMWGCFDQGKIIGVIAAKPPCHISLLFVDKAYHRQGVARTLLQTVSDYYRLNGGHTEMTVNSSPYAVEAYRRLGFTETGEEQTVNGLRFTPMKYVFRP